MKKIIALMLALLMFIGTCAIADGLLGGWTVAENTAITEEQKAAGVIFILQNEAGFRLVGTYQSLGDNNVEYLIDELQKAGATGISEISINELPAIEYDLLTPDGVQSSSLVYFNANDNTFLTISFAPIDNEDFQEVVKIIMASIQLVSEAE